MCPVLVVPLGNQIQFALRCASRERNDCQQRTYSLTVRMQRLDDGNAAVLTSAS